MKCGACRRDCRTTKIAFVADSEGGLRRARVCGRCFLGAIHIVPSVVRVTKGADETNLRRREAATATKDAGKKLRNMAKAYGRSRLSGEPDMARGLELAADILEAGDY